MQRFARLYEELDQSNKTNDKVAALVRYFSEAPDDDKMWALALLTGRRPRRQVNATQLRQYAVEYAGIPLWLFEESYHVVGDLGETVALLLPAAEELRDATLTETMAFLATLDKLPEADRHDAVLEAWATLTQQERMVFTKLITGSFRVGVSVGLVIRGLAELTGQTGAALSHRVMGGWEPDKVTFEELVLGEQVADDLSRPYPFFLAYPIDDPGTLGNPEEWSAEWKWDGIRSQMIRREGHSFIWSRGEDLVTDKFPELAALCARLPEGTVIDGEILPILDGRLAPFALLQTRIGRKNLTAKILKEAPVGCYVYDLLELNGQDLRERPFVERRAMLKDLVEAMHDKALVFSEAVLFSSWEELATTRLGARDAQAEGFMIKRLAAPYGVGRRRGDWWKWKIEPYAVDAVMIYAQRGHGRRADLFTDYTFAVWDADPAEGGKLVPFAKAYSGLTDVEIGKVDRWVKANTIEKFGPVRTVKPQLVFEIGFEGIQASPRHKSGIAVRFPRILNWRHDKPIDEADTLDTLKALMGNLSTDS